MKKGFRGTGTVERVDFPNKGIAVTDDGDREDQQKLLKMVL